ncbi:unnamed protein product [Owenia fusiformis]|uniref:Beta-galactosidase n=1 Tax=Owenia fusiformis TaxID=6347 RepID=A0A8J1TS89_OWEFU|nr:unnamed protein product [Owenia fusiformis]
MSTALEARERSFFLNGEKLVLVSGAVHYFRIVPEYWRDRLIKMKACGLNAVETYVPWNLHEEVRGEFNFEGMLDVRKFIQIAQEVGLLVLFRPGPYICGEWDFGGLPSWLLHDPEMKVRSSYKPYTDAVGAYFGKLLPLVEDLQFSKGGPIVAMQVENEYGSYGNDKEYISFLKATMEKYKMTELFFTSENGMGVQRDNLPGVLVTANFQEYDHGYMIFEYLKNIKQPDMPLMVMEFWTGWFDHWTEKHHVWKSKEFKKVLDYILSEGSSVNFYMFHGGTNFGWMNGANEGLGATNEAGKEPYRADVTSYDYDAPLAENGDVTEKFHLIKELVQKYLPNQVTSLPDLPPNIPSTTYGKLSMTSYLNMNDLLTFIKQIESKKVVPMEMLDINNGGGQSFGFILYRTTISQGKQVKLTGTVKDRAIVYLNGEQIDVLDCTVEDHVIPLELASGENTLEILVENMGRVNYGDFQSPILNDQRKGLRNDVQLDGKVINSWIIFPMEFKKSFLQDISESFKWMNSDSSVNVLKSPRLFKATLDISSTPQDTYIDMQGWDKGNVFVNGFNLGRYWEIGPQQTLYIPAPLLKEGQNEVLVFELHSAKSAVSLTDKPHLGETVDQKLNIPFHLQIWLNALKLILRYGGWLAWPILKRIM